MTTKNLEDMDDLRSRLTHILGHFGKATQSFVFYLAGLYPREFSLHEEETIRRAR